MRPQEGRGPAPRPSTFGIAGLALTAVLTVIPAGHAGADGVPHWPASSDPVLVVDEVAATIPLGRGRLRAWRRLRNEVVAAWSLAGIAFAVVERPAGPCEPGAGPAGALLLCWNLYGWAVPGTFPHFPEGHIPEATATVPSPRWWAGVCHEFGHALGLGHSAEGCMKASPGEGIRPGARLPPSASDLALLAAARDHLDQGPGT